jgi:energy-coupling factor transporter ATP-binding protein EcfA2
MTTVLQTLSLGAYRGISGLVLDGLTPVTLVVGANNSGKSSILEAAGLVLRPPDPTQWVSAVRHRDSDGSFVDGLWAVFPASEVLDVDAGPHESNVLVLEAALGAASRHVEARCFAAPLSAQDEPELVKVGFESQTVAKRDVTELSARVELSVNGDPALTLKFPSSTVAMHQIPLYRVFSVTPATHYSTKALVEHLSFVVDAGKKQLAVELLQLFDAAIEDLDVVASAGREAVRVTHRTRGVVDLASFGDGTRRAATLALALTRASQGVLLVDELETGMHPSVLRSVLARLVEAAATSQTQILATTHSLEAVDAMISAVDDRRTPDVLTTFWLQRRENKHEVRRYDFAKLRTLREGGLDIR